MATELIVIASLAAWYGIGLLGSCIGLRTMTRNIAHRYPSYRAEPLLESGFGLGMAVLGPLNLLAVLIYRAISEPL